MIFKTSKNRRRKLSFLCTKYNYLKATNLRTFVKSYNAPQVTVMCCNVIEKPQQRVSYWAMKSCDHGMPAALSRVPFSAVGNCCEETVLISLLFVTYYFLLHQMGGQAMAHSHSLSLYIKHGSSILN